jgi:hypothetical protein
MAMSLTLPSISFPLVTRLGLAGNRLAGLALSALMPMLVLVPVLVLVLLPGHAAAQGFAAYVSPPRFEIGIEPGQRSRQVVEIQHVGRQEGAYRFYTADWTLAADYSVNFQTELAPNSCRPWVAIERKELTFADARVHDDADAPRHRKADGANAVSP